MKRSSTVANQRGVPARLEHGRQDGWTFTPRGSDDGKKGSESVTTAGERLQNQRPHGYEHPEHNSDEHLGAQVPHQDEETDSTVLHSSSNASEFKNDNKKAQRQKRMKNSWTMMLKSCDSSRRGEAHPTKRNND